MLDLLKAEEGRVLFTPSASIADNDETTVINPASSENWKPLTGAYIDDSFLIDFLTPEEYIDFIAKANGAKRIDWKHIDDPESPMAPFLAFTHGEIFGQKSSYAISVLATSKRLASLPPCLRNRSC